MFTLDFRLKKNQKLRKEIYERDNFTCIECGFHPEANTKNYDGKYTLMSNSNWLEVDHIKPRALGGNNDISNLQTLCNICNTKKGARW